MLSLIRGASARSIAKVMLGEQCCAGIGNECMLKNARRYASSSIPEESDWWLVEGRLMSVSQLRRVRKGVPGDLHSSKRKRLTDRMNHISRWKLPELDDQRQYWNRYMKVYEEARDEWEILVWDSHKNQEPEPEVSFFDAPLLKKTKKKDLRDENKKPFSMEEIQAAIRENIKRPAENNIEYRTASDSKWPF